MSDAIKIVITGGVPEERREAIHQIQAAVAQIGYTSLLLPDAETLLAESGVSLETCGSAIAYQNCLLSFQTELEHFFTRFASTIPTDKRLLLCERGVLNGGACLSNSEVSFAECGMNCGILALQAQYDAVFLLSPVDAQLTALWTGHPHLRLMGDGTPSEQIQRLSSEVTAFLGEWEIERKFLIEYPDLAWLERLPACRCVELVQTYLTAQDGDEVRVRRRSADGSTLYYKTVKRALSGMKRMEWEQRLTEEEYHTLLDSADPTRRPIEKKRYYFVSENQYFELDLYPFWPDRAILELELCNETMPVRLPKELKVIREVTDDPAYKNAALARRFYAGPPLSGS